MQVVNIQLHKYLRVSVESLVDVYRKGAITADHLVVQCLHMIDANDPALVLDALPREIVARAREFTRQYRPSGMITNYGPLPTADQVEAARQWIERHLLETGQATDGVLKYPVRA
jgi:hypothetical protein